MSYSIPKSTTSVPGIITLANDLGGTDISPTVIGIRSISVPSPSGSNTVLTYNAGAYSWAASGSSVIWADDLAGSTNTDQWVGAISGSGGSGGTVVLNITTLQFATGQTTPAINQASTSSGSGTTLTIQAQGATGAVHNGGNLILSSGTSGSATVGNVILETGGTTRLTISPSNITIAAFSVAGVVHNDASGNLSSSLIVNADVSSSAVISVSKLAAGTAGQVLLNNATPTPTWTTLSSDVTISATGVATVNSISGATPIAITPAELQFKNTTSLPIIDQASTSSSSGTNLTIRAQGATGAVHNGGDLILSGGTSGSADAGTVQFSGSQRVTVSSLQTTSYQIVKGDFVVGIGTLGGAITVTLPASPTAGDTYNVKDVNGTCSPTNIITIDAGASNFVDAAQTYPMDIAYSSITLTCTSVSPNQWSII